MILSEVCEDRAVLPRKVAEDIPFRQRKPMLNPVFAAVQSLQCDTLCIQRGDFGGGGNFAARFFDGHADRADGRGRRINTARIDGSEPHMVSSRVDRLRDRGGEVRVGGRGSFAAEGVIHDALRASGQDKLLVLGVIGEIPCGGRFGHVIALYGVALLRRHAAKGDGRGVFACVRGRARQYCAVVGIGNGDGVHAGDGAGDRGLRAEAVVIGGLRRGQNGEGTAAVALGADGVERHAVGGIAVIMGVDRDPVGNRAQLVADRADVVVAGLRKAELVSVIDPDAPAVQLLLLPEPGQIQLHTGHVRKHDAKTAVTLQVLGLIAHRADVAAADCHDALRVCVGFLSGDGDLQRGGGKKVCVFGIFIRVRNGSIDILVNDIFEEAGAGPDRSIARIAGSRVFGEDNGRVTARPFRAVRVHDDPVPLAGAEAVVGRIIDVQALQLEVIGIGGIPDLHVSPEIVEILIAELLGVDKAHVRRLDLDDAKRLQRGDGLHLRIGGVQLLQEGRAHRGDGGVGRGELHQILRVMDGQDLQPVDALVQGALILFDIRSGIFDGAGVEIRPCVGLEARFECVPAARAFFTGTEDDLVADADRAVVARLDHRIGVALAEHHIGIRRQRDGDRLGNGVGLGDALPIGPALAEGVRLGDGALYLGLEDPLKAHLRADREGCAEGVALRAVHLTRDGVAPGGGETLVSGYLGGGQVLHIGGEGLVGDTPGI